MCHLNDDLMINEELKSGADYLWPMESLVRTYLLICIGFSVRVKSLLRIRPDWLIFAKYLV